MLSPFIDLSPTQKLIALAKEAGIGSYEEAIATGNPLRFSTDLARPLKSLLIPFTPVQSGTGDPSPENIRPILPWNGLKVWNGGKNLLNPNLDDWSIRLTTYYYINGVVPEKATARFTLEVKDDTADISGCYLGFVAEDLAESSPVNYRCVIENGTVKSDMSNLSSGSAQFQRRCSNVFIYPATNETVQKLFNRFNIMVELGTTATAYEQYKPITETDISFPSPVYGGTLDVVSGVLTVEWAGKVYTGAQDELWSTESISAGRNFYISTPSEWKRNTLFGDLLCNVGKVSNNMGENVVRISSSGNLNACIGDAIGISTVAEFREWLSTNNMQVAVKLATPQEITLTPEQITALKGDNTIWSDADGSMTAVYLKKG